MYTFGLWDSNLLIERFSTWIQLFVLKKFVVSTQFDIVYVCKYMVGGFGHRYAPTSFSAVEHHKWPVDNLSVRPCGLGRQQLGPCHNACDSNAPVHSHFALGRITSHPALLPHILGEDDSPKPS